jgi:hypothetical protein
VKPLKDRLTALVKSHSFVGRDVRDLTEQHAAAVYWTRRGAGIALAMAVEEIGTPSTPGPDWRRDRLLALLSELDPADTQGGTR